MNRPVAARLAEFWMRHATEADKASNEGDWDKAGYHATIANALAVVAGRTPLLGEAIDRLSRNSCTRRE